MKSMKNNVDRTIDISPFLADSNTCRKVASHILYKKYIIDQLYSKLRIDHKCKQPISESLHTEKIL